MADTNGVNVCEGTQKLVHIQFDLERGHGLLEFHIVSGSAVYSLGNVFENKIKVDFVFLISQFRRTDASQNQESELEKRKVLLYLVSIGVEEGFEIDDVRVGHQPHNLKFTIL